MRSLAVLQMAKGINHQCPHLFLSTDGECPVWAQHLGSFSATVGRVFCFWTRPMSGVKGIRRRPAGKELCAAGLVLPSLGNPTGLFLVDASIA